MLKLNLLAPCFVLVAALFPFAWSVPVSIQELEGVTAKGYRLLDLQEGSEPVWKTEEEKLELLRQGVHFFDITEVYDPAEAAITAETKPLSTNVNFPAPSHLSTISLILDTLSTTNMQDYLAKLTSFNNRHYTTSTGKAASQYIFDTVTAFAEGRDDITVTKFAHSWAQFSVIAHINGSSPSAPLVILGAHEDSINLADPSTGRAPGADDDGSGTVNLLEVFRALVAADFRPSAPVEFHWYSGEEAGLLGSQAVAKAYRQRGAEIRAMLELDMTGYFAPDTKEVIALEADYMDAGETAFLKQLVEAYSVLDWAMDAPCGYACSDHSSWYKQGYTTGMLYEAVTGDDNPHVHSTSDTTAVEGFSWSHSLEFAKVALAYVYELAI